MRAILLGILASFFFAFTFLLNRSMSITGGSWLWSASLRYVFMMPLLLIVVVVRGNLRSVVQELIQRPLVWILWSTVGFGLFYAPLCLASVYGPAWLVASTWQITIISGSLLAPFFYDVVHTGKGAVKKRKRIPKQGLLLSCIILAGIFVLQFQQAADLSLSTMLLGFVPVLLASFAYPLGNRKMMELCRGRLNAYERVLGMTIASMPFWLILSCYAWLTEGLPRVGQIEQSVLVAVFSGVIATVFFFAATDRVRDSIQQLAAVEATQAGEVIFTVLGEKLLLKDTIPTGTSTVGILLVVAGMIMHSLFAHNVKRSRTKHTKHTGISV